MIMGIVNATPDSFSDAGELPDLEARVARGAALLEAGADVLDVGGESSRGDRPPVPAEVEIERVSGVIERLAALGATVSVDTHKPAVARAALAAGAVLVNDVSGLRDPALADLCAETGAGLDPGPDFAKTPAQTVAVLRRLDAIHALGRPVLLAASRKDFVGAITGRPPRERLAGTLAAIGEGVDAGAQLLRVHDVGAVRDFLAVREVLRGERELAPAEGLTPDRYPDGPPPGLALG
jgi:dihydropteroate synthase